MLLSNEKQFIFIHIPKTAGQSVTRALSPWCVSPNKNQFRRLLSHLPVPEDPNRAWLRAHDKASWIRRKLPSDVFGYFKFAVVRNPYDYAVSYFHYLRKNKGSRRHRDAQSWSFGDFLHYMEIKNGAYPVTQSSWITGRHGEVLVDDLLRFETLDRDFPRLLARLGIPDDTALPRINTTERGHYRDFYSARERELAERLFRTDLDRFGYEF